MARQAPQKVLEALIAKTGRPALRAEPGCERTHLDQGDRESSDAPRFFGGIGMSQGVPQRASFKR
jgi:hypothetical protein